MYFKRQQTCRWDDEGQTEVKGSAERERGGQWEKTGVGRRRMWEVRKWLYDVSSEVSATPLLTLLNKTELMWNTTDHTLSITVYSIFMTLTLFSESVGLINTQTRTHIRTHKADQSLGSVSVPFAYKHARMLTHKELCSLLHWPMHVWAAIKLPQQPAVEALQYSVLFMLVTYLTASFYPSTQFWNLSFPRQWRTCCPLNPDSIHRLFSPAPLSLSCTRSLSFSASVSFYLSHLYSFSLESWCWWRLWLWTVVPLSVCPLLTGSLNQRTHGHSFAATHETKQKKGTFCILLTVVLGHDVANEKKEVK